MFVSMYDGTTWSAPSEIDKEELRAVSCASPSFCVAVGEHDAVMYDGSAWATPSPIWTKAI